MQWGLITGGVLAVVVVVVVEDLAGETRLLLDDGRVCNLVGVNAVGFVVVVVVSFFSCAMVAIISFKVLQYKCSSSMVSLGPCCDAQDTVMYTLLLFLNKQS